MRVAPACARIAVALRSHPVAMGAGMAPTPQWGACPLRQHVRSHVTWPGGHGDAVACERRFKRG